MTQTFKVGDVVRITNMEGDTEIALVGRAGCVVVVNPVANYPIDVRLFDGQEGAFKASELEHLDETPQG